MFRPTKRLVEMHRNIASDFIMKLVTKVTVIPCRLNVDSQEWRNEVPAVPNRNPLNTLSWCKGQGFPVGSEDPVKLYCSLLLRRESCCVV